jgi:hypothetical protein
MMTEPLAFAKDHYDTKTNDDTNRDIFIYNDEGGGYGLVSRCKGIPFCKEHEQCDKYEPPLGI